MRPVASRVDPDVEQHPLQQRHRCFLHRHLRSPHRGSATPTERPITGRSLTGARRRVPPLPVTRPPTEPGAAVSRGPSKRRPSQAVSRLPPSSLHEHPISARNRECGPVTRGRRGSLPLRRRALPSPPPCRFIPALRKVSQNHLPRPTTGPTVMRKAKKRSQGPTAMCALFSRGSMRPSGRWSVFVSDTVDSPEGIHS